MSKQLYVPYGANIEQGLDVKGGLTADSIAATSLSVSNISLANQPVTLPVYDWFGMMGAIFQAKTGLAPSQWVIETAENFVRYNNGWSADVIATGTGATALPDPTYGSAVLLKAPTGGSSGSVKWFPGAAATILGQSATQTVKDPLLNAAQKRWMFAFNIGPGGVAQSTIGGNTLVCGLSIANDSFTAGVGVSGGTNMQAVINGSPVAGAASDLGISINAFGASQGSAYVANFNFSQWVININPGVAADVVAGNSQALPLGTARPCIELAGSTLVQQAISFDNVFFCREL